MNTQRIIAGKAVKALARKTLSVVLVLLLLCTSVPLTAMADGYVLGTYKCIASSTLNIRADSTGSGTIVGVLYNGDIVTITKIENTKWGYFSNGSKSGWVSLAYMELISATSFNVGDSVMVVQGATDYNGTALSSHVYSTVYTIISINGDRAVIGINGAVTAAVNTSNLYLVGGNVDPTGISLSKTSLSITAGSSSTLTATVSPSNATNKSVTWSSSNTGVATVSGGTVTGVSAGSATITARTSNGYTATCSVTVTAGGGSSSGLAVGDKITINAGATNYGTTTTFASFVYSTVYEIISISGDRIVFGNNGAVTGAVAASNVTKVGEGSGNDSYYAQGENKIYAYGIDVSKWQANINWSQVAQDKVDFAIIRAAVNTAPGNSLGKDGYFEQNYTNAKAAGIPIGIYVYACANTEAQARTEADQLYNIIKGKTFEYPIFYDAEDESQKSVGKLALAKTVVAFLDRMSSYGYYCATYTGQYFVNSYIDLNTIGKNYDVWIAQYPNSLYPESGITPTAAAPTVATYTASKSKLYGMWQYTSRGRINGISGNVDMSVSYKDFPRIIRERGLNGMTPSTPTASTPTLSTSNVAGGKKVTLSCSISGATIYYTTNGSAPTTSSTKYTGAFTLSSASTTVKAIAVASGYNNSPVMTQTVSISKTATPAISAANAVASKTVTISCSTSGATIYYTTDGSAPSTSSTKYTGAFTVSAASTTVKAIAVTSGYLNSDTASSTVSISAAATPSISTSNVNGGKSVSISCSTSGATVYYTTDGSTPTTSSTKYTAAFTLTAASTTVKAIAVASGYFNSSVASSTVSISKAETPSISTSNVNGGKSVTISCSTSGATVYYTTNGSAPTASSTKYTGAFTLTASSTTVKAVAIASGYLSSEAASSTVSVSKTATPSITTSNVSGGVSVAISCSTSGASIYYTTDGSAPSASSTKYSGAFTVTSASATVKAIAVTSGYSNSDVATKDIGIAKAATPSITTTDVEGGKSVTISCSTSGATIYYTTNGNNPTTSSTKYTGAFTLSSASTTVKAIAVASGYANSEIGSKTVTITNVATPSITTSTSGSTVTVTISCSTSGATVYYTTNGSTPTKSSTKYTGAFTLNTGSVTIKAIAVANGYFDSAVASKTTDKLKTATPVMTLTNYVGGKYMALTCDTEGAVIYYTTDGTDPTTSSKQYSAKVKLSAASYTIKAYAVAEGSTDSDIMVENIEIPRVETPVVSTMQNGDTVTVSISCTTSGATVRYTTDGSTPTTTSAEYTAPFTVNSATTVSAIATLNGYRNSAKCTENVKIGVTSLTLSQSTLTLNVEKTATLTVSSVLPANASDTAVTWTSSNESVAVVTDGVVTGISGGQANIIATAGSGAFAVCSVTVIDNKGDYFLKIDSADDLKSNGYYIFATGTTAAGKIDSSIAKATEVTVNNGRITSTYASAVWILQKSGDEYYLKNAYSKKYLGGADSTAVTESDTGVALTLNLQKDGTFTVINTNAGNRFLGYNKSTGYKWYAASSSKTTYPGYFDVYRYMGDGIPSYLTDTSEYSVTVKAGTGGTVSQTYTSSMMSEGTSVTVTATANEGYKFSAWVDENNNVVGSNAKLTFTVNANVNYTAVFEQLKCGAVTANPASGTVAEGTSITLTAASGEKIMYSTDGKSYKEYTQPIVPTAYPVTIYAYAARTGYINGDTVTFTYDAVHEDTGVYALIIDNSYLKHNTKVALVFNGSLLNAPTGGMMALSSITFDSNGTFAGIGNDNSWIIEQYGTQFYLKNASTGKYLAWQSSTNITTSDTPHALDITKQADGTFLITHGESGRFFGYNNSDGFKLYAMSNLSKNSGYINIYIYTEGAIPDANLYSVIAVSDGHGTVTNNYAGMSLTSGTQVTVSAQPNEGYVFKAWLDGNGQTASTSAEFTFTLTSNVHYTATFEQLKCGTVTANPASGTVAQGTSITLTASVSGETVMYSVDGTNFVEYSLPIVPLTYPVTIYAYAARNGYKNGDTVTFTYDAVQEDTGVYALIIDNSYLKHNTKLALVFNGSLLNAPAGGMMALSDITFDSDGTFAGIGNGNVWILEQNGTTFYLKNADTGKYLAWQSSTNITTSDTPQALNIAKQADGTFLITHVESGRFFGYNNSDGFKLYAASNLSKNSGYINIYIYTEDAIPDASLYTVVAEPDEHGSVENNFYGMSLTSGTQVTITAEPDSGYKFKAWVDENGQTVSTSAVFTFTLTSNVHYTATFEQLKCGAVTANPASGEIAKNSTIILSAANGETIMYSINGGEYVQYTGAITASEFPLSISAYTVRENYINGDTVTFSYTTPYIETGVYTLIQDSSYIDTGIKFAFAQGNKLIGKITGGAATTSEVIISGSKISSVDAINSWTLEKNGDNYFIKNVSTGKYLALGSSTNVVNSDEGRAFSIVKQLDGTFVFTHIESGRFLGYNGSNGFKLYTSTASNQNNYNGSISIYMYTEEDTPIVQYVSVITVCSDGHGTVTPVYSAQSIVNGTELTLSAQPDSGYRFVAWLDSNGNKISEQQTFTLTVSKSETYIASFEQLICGAVTSDHANGVIAPGTQITLTTLYGADIMYSLNGSEYVKYTGAITVAQLPLTVYAYAVKDGYIDGALCTFSYTAPAEEVSYGGTFVKISSLADITSGEQYVIACGQNAITASVTSNALVKTEVATGANRITTDNSDIIWIIEATDVQGIYKLMSANKTYLYGTASSANVSLKDTGIELRITALANGGFKIEQNNTSGRYLGYSVSGDYFKWFTSTSSSYVSSLEIYKLNPDAGEAVYYNVSVTSDGNGELAENISGSYAEGTSITVSAAEQYADSFIGWYNENEELVSQDSSYTFTVVSDVQLMARFVLMTLGNANGDDKLDNNDITFMLDFLTGVVDLDEKFAEFADFNDDGVVNLLDAYLLYCLINNG